MEETIAEARQHQVNQWNRIEAVNIMHIIIITVVKKMVKKDLNKFLGLWVSQGAIDNFLRTSKTHLPLSKPICTQNDTGPVTTELFCENHYAA